MPRVMLSIRKNKQTNQTKEKPNSSTPPPPSDQSTRQGSDRKALAKDHEEEWVDSPNSCRQTMAIGSERTPTRATDGTGVLARSC